MVPVVRRVNICQAINTTSGVSKVAYGAVHRLSGNRSLTVAALIGAATVRERLSRTKPSLIAKNRIGMSNTAWYASIAAAAMAIAAHTMRPDRKNAIDAIQNARNGRSASRDRKSTRLNSSHLG